MKLEIVAGRISIPQARGDSQETDRCKEDWICD